MLIHISVLEGNEAYNFYEIVYQIDNFPQLVFFLYEPV